jgi:DNA-binding transcriptional ArsR family regulator
MDDKPQDDARPPGSTRRIDARTLRGLAHPLRMRILEALTLDGPATSTGLASRLGENTGTVSWHLRHLAQHGFIEEEKERGTRRERWWRVVRETRVLRTAEFRDDPLTRGALSVYMHELVQQQFARVMDYVTEDWEADWQGAGSISDWGRLRLTPDQLTALNADLAAVIARHTPAPDAEPEPGALPVIVQIQAFPRRERRKRQEPQEPQERGERA